MRILCAIVEPPADLVPLGRNTDLVHRRRICPKPTLRGDGFHDALAEQLLKMTAATVHGVLAKARVLRRDFLTEESLDADLQEQLDGIGRQSEAFTISIARDMLRLANGEANG